ncbi:hypothetical protein STCU_06204 [Strigomonas culicis]|nr:hypothetical protein STCU_06204 [Strigomonas culicis]|eukprot:EPY26333.1 hypothetical protein STCU_06204 [Strigomonas culicis]
MVNLEELDLSDNINLDDPNMTLFSLQNLKKLNVTGCPFAENPSKARNEWFDIAKLSYLKDLKWEQWKVNHNMSSYRTRIPIEICGMQLERINEIDLRHDLYTGNTVKTVVNLLRDGYFKVDLSVDDDTVYSHCAAVHIFAKAEEFFFPKDSAIKHAPNPDSSRVEPVVYGSDLGAIHLRIAICRYIFFLAVQAANYDAVIIPPLDVMVMHYSQVTCSPGKYRADCEAVCGRVLNCNYRNFFIEQQRHGTDARDAIAASRNIWNLMVRSAQRDLKWLRYDFWERQLRGASNVEGVATQDTGAISPLPLAAIGRTAEEVFHNVNALRDLDAAQDLSVVMDPSISSYFEEQGEATFALGLQSFFATNRLFIQHADVLDLLQLDWTRYIKFLALYAYRVATHRSDQSLVMEPTADAEGNLYAPRGPVPHQTSILGPHYDLMNNISFAAPDKYLPQPAAERPSALTTDAAGSDTKPVKRNVSVLSRAPAANRNTEEQRQAAIMRMNVNPVPTIGLTLLLHTHRTTHVKYYQTLNLLGIDDIDIFWLNNANAVRETRRAWGMLFSEDYVNASASFVAGGDMDEPLLPPTAATGTQLVAEYDATVVPTVSALKGRGKSDKSNKQVSLCGGDAEHGVF